MSKIYIIDGNNLIGKISFLHRLQKKDKQSPREKLAFMIDNYFHDKKINVSLHFDGFEKLPVKTSGIKIIYSNNREADQEIKDQISRTKNKKHIVVVTSDLNLAEFAKVCSCEVMTSDEFGKKLVEKKSGSIEDEIIKGLNSRENIQEFKDLFKGEKGESGEG